MKKVKVKHRSLDDSSTEARKWANHCLMFVPWEEMFDLEGLLQLFTVVTQGEKLCFTGKTFRITSKGILFNTNWFKNQKVWSLCEGLCFTKNRYLNLEETAILMREERIRYLDWGNLADVTVFERYRVEMQRMLALYFYSSLYSLIEAYVL
jgi:hypothetical protein